MTPCEIHFGGPSQSPGYLRDMLAARIAAVPAGGTIDWVTYYFRDCELAEALIHAKRRGVNVKVCLSGQPRLANANDEVIDMLSGECGLGSGLRKITFPGISAPGNRAWRPQIHEKLYCFSHPDPIAFIGSFNPSGNSSNERPEILREIGDQDRGYNVLVGIRNSYVVEALMQHVRQFWRNPPDLMYRFSDRANPTITDEDIEIHFLPSIRPHPVVQILRSIGKDARVCIAASHIRMPQAVDVMTGLARRGARVEIIANHTHRRVTPAMERQLLAAGIQISRVGANDDLPMHLKFVLIEDQGRLLSIFGSFNWTKPSFWLNHEIIAISTNPQIFEAFSRQWALLQSMKFAKPFDYSAYSSCL